MRVVVPVLTNRIMTAPMNEDTRSIPVVEHIVVQLDLGRTLQCIAHPNRRLRVSCM
eukprot:COSAG01_NODE_2541_length_7477_cov_3.164226_4_plen_56_part_00